MQKHNPYVVSSTLDATQETEILRQFLEACYFSGMTTSDVQDIKNIITENFHNLDDLLQHIVDEQTARTNLPQLSEHARNAIIRDVNFVRQRVNAGKTKLEALQDLKRANAARKRIEDRLRSING
jgi:hypothetical protein